MDLITDWKQAYKFLSVQFAGLGASALFAYLAMYDKMSKVLPPQYMMTITLVVFVLVVLGRVTAQDIDVAEDSK